MFSLETKAAVAMLQQRARVSVTSDTFALDRLDRALDQLVDSPTKTSPPDWQVRDALANGLKVLARRAALHGAELDNPDLADSRRREYENSSHHLPAPARSVGTYPLFWWLAHTTMLTDDERSILFLLSQGEDAESMAARSGESVTSMRQRISRARKAGRLAYDAEMSAW